jgi:SAM-dependent methyltransferase
LRLLDPTPLNETFHLAEIVSHSSEYRIYMHTSTDSIVETPAPSTPITSAAGANGPGKDKRKSLVGLLRGYFAGPVIAVLGETGLADRMLAEQFTVSDISTGFRRDLVFVLCHYLLSIGLLKERSNEQYSLTSSGRTILERNGAFSLLMSYADYFHELPELLRGTLARPVINRRRNVRGSGQLHSRKFFPSAFEMLSGENVEAVIDVGCGDGCFLAHTLEKWPRAAVFGVDLSPAAVESTQERLKSSTSVTIADGFDVALWSVAIPTPAIARAKLLVSLWFVAHEFSHGSVDRVIEFFDKLKLAFPEAQVLLGEINNIRADVLAANHERSIMPEFLLFHALSGQGVLEWSAWQRVLQRIPYELKCEAKFDEVQSDSGESIPASFVWLLGPK